MAAVEQARRTDVAAVRRTEAITLRIAGHSQQAVADKLGVTQQRVSAMESEWLASQKPSSEVTEQRRQMQLAGIDEIRARLVRLLEDEADTPTRLSVVDRIAKLWEREAKLVGLDMQPGIQVGLLSREALVAVLGLDEPLVIEGTAVEIEPGADA